MLPKRFLVVLATALLFATSLTGLADATSGNGNLINQTFQFAEDTVNMCNGAQVMLNGTIHSVENQVDDSTLLVNLSGHLKGNDENGNPYVLNFSIHSTQSSSSSAATEREILVSKGPAPNELVTITYSESGVTVTSDCAGSAG